MPAKQRAPLPNRTDIALAGDRPDVHAVYVSAIRTDGGTQMRAGLNTNTVADYTQWLDDLSRQPNGLAQMPPLVVYHDGTDYWLADGFHRLAAWKTIARLPVTVQAIVRAGTRRDAILHAAGANSDHGLRRSPADKWRAVEALLVDEEWGQWSDRQIAEACRVSPTFVGNVRKSLGRGDRPQYAPPPLPVTVHVDSEKRTYTTKHGTVATMDTGKIGQRPTAELPPSLAAAGFVYRPKKQGWADGALSRIDDKGEVRMGLFGSVAAAVAYARNVLAEEQAAQEKPAPSSMDTALAVPADPAWEEEHHAAVEQIDTIALPADLREAGYEIEKTLWNDGKWRWKRMLWGGPSFEVSPTTFDSPIDALLDARKRNDARVAQPPAGDITPPDLRAAGLTVERFGDKWRWRRSLPLGGTEYGLPRHNPKEVIDEVRNERPSLLVPPVWLDAGVVAEAAANSNAHRCDSLSRLARLYTNVLATLGDYETITGHYTHTPPLKRALEPMLAAVESMLAALCGEGDDQSD